jgi:hypothetical protein
MAVPGIPFGVLCALLFCTVLAVLALWTLAGAGGAYQLAGGAVAQLIRPPLAVGLAGLAGLTAATMLAMSWTHVRTRLIQAQHSDRTTPGV